MDKVQMMTKPLLLKNPKTFSVQTPVKEVITFTKLKLKPRLKLLKMKKPL